MKPLFFSSAAAWRRWLDKHHASARELWVGFHKRHTGRPSMTWSESVDQALCFGWIDGIRRTYDGNRYVIRFTPRRSGSSWSALNLRKVRELTQLGLMRPAGLAVFPAGDPRKARRYPHQQRTGPDEPLTPALQRTFRRNARAWRFFQQQPPGYRKLATRFVMDAKKDETRIRRLTRLIADSAAGRRIGTLERPTRKAKA